MDDDIGPGETILTVTGNARALLTGERVALNLLGRLSSVATITELWSRQLEGTHTKLIDTRKTTPGLRALEKYAVKVGGGANHRIGLFDGVLIKENHIRAAGSITAGLFLQNFVRDGLSWAHLDIAGPAFLGKAERHLEKGATGAGVLGLLHWLRNY